MEINFQTSRRSLLKFLSVAAPAAAAVSITEERPAGLIHLPDAAETQRVLERPPTFRGGADYDPFWRDGHMYDVQPWMLYDRFGAPVGCETIPGQIQLFADHIGGYRYNLGRPVDFRDTNMFMGGKLPAPEQFLIQRLFFLGSGDRDEVARALPEFAYELQIGGTVYSQGSLFRFRTFDPDGLSNLLPGLKVPESLQKGDRVFFEAVPGRRPPMPAPAVPRYPGTVDFFETTGGLVILNQQYFTIRIRSDGRFIARRPFWIYACLDGMIARAVQ